MITFQEFIENKKYSKHHAIILISKQFEESGFPEAHFRTLVKETCGIELFHNNEVSAFEIAQNHNDIFIADRHRKILRIEDLVKIKELSFYQPSEGNRRLFYIENCDRMNANSANAILKTLEEPQAKSIFILTTKNINLVLPTILSRCQKVYINFNEIQNYSLLQSIHPNDYNSIKLQINSFKNTFPILNQSLHEKETKTLNLSNIKNIIELSEKLSKEYSSNILQDVIVLATNEHLKSNPSFLSIAKSILTNITEWKNSDIMNCSAQLWLIRIFLGYKLN